MDFTQHKLTKQEWEGIEQPVSPEEIVILKMISNGFVNINIKYNNNLSLLQYAKLEQSSAMENYLFNIYLKSPLEKSYKKLANDFSLIPRKTIKKLLPKKRDLIRIENINNSLSENKHILFDFIILDLINKMLSSYSKGNDKWVFYYYTLTHLQNITLKMNEILLDEVNRLLIKFESEVNHNLYFENSEMIMEKNDVLLRYTDIQLYDHQKRIFNIFKSPGPKLVMYVAPTGTGKTLTPIGLSEKYRVIFVCAARHVGLALAKSAVSAGRKIALAFNCYDADEIRLHFSAAKEFTKNYKSGGIYKVDNSHGDNVEIIITDIQSYIISMFYMTAFNNKENIITYWDEPTITMDYESHPFHEIIKTNWRDNIIPNIVLSSATLPRDDEIKDVLDDYIYRFQGEPISIISADCNNSIPLISKEGCVTLPHHLSENSNYTKLSECINHCKKNTSLIRYMDLTGICQFLLYLNNNNYIVTKSHSLMNYFEHTGDITIHTIKLYYLDIFSKIAEENWGNIYNYFQQNRTVPYKSNIMITTTDAHTLTHGPSIYLANDVEKVAKFYIQHSKIPSHVIEHINSLVCKNEKINNDIEKMEKTFEDAMVKESEKDKKMGDDGRMPPEMKVLRQKIEVLQQRISSISMPEIFIPNSPEHIYKWCNGNNTKNSFIPEISDKYVIKLMQLNDVEPMWKLLLLMGIGVFMKHKSVGYVEIMKELVEQQKLFIILATDDYIYGTNYQFCHGYIGKDLQNLTQEKLIQALGRIGRNKQNKDYSIRLRDNSFLTKIFTPLDVKQEAVMMNKLFNSSV